MSLKEGDIAPDFRAASSAGKEVGLSQFKGKNVVLYFYPKDDTPGCTIEAKEFTQEMGQFQDTNTVVLGVSYDDVNCHNSFIEKYGLRIELLADTNHHIATAYESAGDAYSQRNTFVIDPNGKIKKIFRSVKPQGHAQEVLAVIKS